MDTVQQAIAKMEEPKPRRNRAAEVLPLLPPDMPAPLVYDTDASCHFRGGYSLGWSDPSYGRGEYDPVAILRALEAHGFTPCDTSLVKWDSYRPIPEPFGAGELPAHPHGSGMASRYEVSDLWPMLPCWVRPCQHTGPRFHAYYLFGGERYEVRLSVPRSLVTVYARRVEVRGGWYYERGTAGLRHPDKLHDIRTNGGEVVAMRHAKSFATAGVVSGQDMDGALYWESVVEDFPMTPADVLAYALADND